MSTDATVMLVTTIIWAIAMIPAIVLALMSPMLRDDTRPTGKASDQLMASLAVAFPVVIVLAVVAGWAMHVAGLPLALSFGVLLLPLLPVVIFLLAARQSEAANRREANRREHGGT